MDYLEHHIVDHCNLNCAGCSHFSPLAGGEWFEDLESFKRDFRQLYDVTNGDIKIIRLMGGEPLLHPKFDEFVSFACELFNNSQVQIVTNGILIGKTYIYDQLKTLSDQYSNFSICISSYGLKLDEERIRQLPRVRRDDKTSLYNIGLDLEGGINPNTAFNHCDLHVHHWYFFQHGCFYPCCIGANIEYLNLQFDLDLPSYGEACISIYNHTLAEIEEFLNKPIPLCRYCNTVYRQKSYHPFSISKKELSEWTYQ